MAEQLEHLAKLAGRPRVQIQLWPFESMPDTGVFAQRFVLLRVPPAHAAQPFTFAYCEDLDAARYVDEPQAVRMYEAQWGAMQAAALGPRQTRNELGMVARQLRERVPDSSIGPVPLSRQRRRTRE
jgi:hypothetical protein